ncbi:cytochrome P450 [Aspergillus mulundensis]|uniref:Cytochrome P450 n=1 Tax=Aspergillus mulundensis TaxID=1810919 RepID=A0A3D8T2Y6_9EURO|nr:hypothetical protein DSM5745_00235 [Aspergillus mulundensis]RDW92913.1 hypothetical protein DSM5745_00235 [Aspergillus mulundensis]
MAVLTHLTSATSTTLLLHAGLCLVLYICTRLVYNIYLHPLSIFPGPKLAVCSPLHEFYYDVICRGMFMWEIEKMHELYGPIVRINPREIHIKDPEFIDVVYASGTHIRTKDPQFTPALSSPHSVISTIDHNHHRKRKSYLKAFFSRRSLETLGPFIQESVELLCEKFRHAHAHKQTLRLDSLYSDLTADIITYYAFGSSYGYLRGDGAANDILSGVNELTMAFHVNRFFPVFRRILSCIPVWLLQRLRPSYAQSLALLNGLRQQSENALARTPAAVLENGASSKETIFSALSSPHIPASERTVPRLMDEGFAVLGAGTVTTARTLALASFHIFSNSTILENMRTELVNSVMPDLNSTPSWADLERLPYLTAVITEALRLSHGVTFRQARIAPDEALVFRDWVIPAGTPVAISTYLTHMDPSIFPSPQSFDPERWIRAKEQGFPLHKYLLAFSRGSRQCLGMR